jgi:hypothetical protein
MSKTAQCAASNEEEGEAAMRVNVYLTPELLGI